MSSFLDKAKAVAARVGSVVEETVEDVSKKAGDIKKTVNEKVDSYKDNCFFFSDSFENAEAATVGCNALLDLYKEVEVQAMTSFQDKIVILFKVTK